MGCTATKCRNADSMQPGEAVPAPPTLKVMVNAEWQSAHRGTFTAVTTFKYDKPTGSHLIDETVCPSTYCSAYSDDALTLWHGAQSPTDTISFHLDHLPRNVTHAFVTCSVREEGKTFDDVRRTAIYELPTKIAALREELASMKTKGWNMEAVEDKADDVDQLERELAAAEEERRTQLVWAEAPRGEIGRMKPQTGNHGTYSSIVLMCVWRDKPGAESWKLQAIGRGAKDAADACRSMIPHLAR